MVLHLLSLYYGICLLPKVEKRWRKTNFKGVWLYTFCYKFWNGTFLDNEIGKFIGERERKSKILEFE